MELVSATVEKILKEVKSLSSREREELWDRVAAEEANNLDEWEKQIERDSKAGKLDHLLAELRDDIKAGRLKPLDGVINEPESLTHLTAPRTCSRQSALLLK